jgi:uncharacterized alpha/beta hydrolase family protein
LKIFHQFEWVKKYFTGDLEKTLNYYGEFQSYFEGKSDNYILYYFAHDWRKSNTDNAELLKLFIEEVMKSEPKNNKVNIVAHSNGALIAKKYILDSKKADSNQHPTVKKFISVGAPFFWST